jgi:uncharacterized membrane protein
MKTHVVTKVYIAAPPGEVYRFLTDLQYHPLWNPHLIAVSPKTVLKPDMRYRANSLLFGIKVSGNIRVVNMVEGRELELQNDTGMLRYRVRYRLARKASATQLTCSISVSTESKAFAFARPILSILAERELHSDLNSLKALAEGQTSPEPAASV